MHDLMLILVAAGVVLLAASYERTYSALLVTLALRASCDLLGAIQHIHLVSSEYPLEYYEDRKPGVCV